MARARIAVWSAGAVLLGAAAPQPAGGAESLEQALAGLDATFVAWDAATGETVRYDPERAAVEVSPCSTFKIPNALIALETGVASGPDHVRAFDAERHPRGQHDDDRRWAEVARDHDLASAIRHSVVWYFQEVAVEIGEERMAAALARFEYGNRDLSSGIDRFWLAASLRISADEQVAFLRRLISGKLASAEATARLRDMLAQDHEGDHDLFAKTGMGWTPEGRALGWWVGWVERPAGPVVFAFRIEADDFVLLRRERIPAARRALAAIGAFPAEPG